MERIANDRKFSEEVIGLGTFTRLRVVAAVALITLLVTGSVLAATGVVQVSLNGKPLTFKTAPRMEDNTLMAPLEEIATSLGIGARWNAATNTLELTDNRTQQLVDLQKRVIELETALQKGQGSQGQSSANTSAPSDLGKSRKNPAPVGTMLSVSLTLNRTNQFQAEFTAKEVIRGERAWQIVQEANRFNDPAPSGYEYVLVKMAYKLVSSTDPDAAINFSDYWFTAVSSSGKDLPRAVVAGLEPEFDANLYVGAMHEGWLAFVVEQDDPAPVLTFARDSQGKNGYWLELKASSAASASEAAPSHGSNSANLKNDSDLQAVLNQDFRKVSTPLGELTLTYTVDANDRTWFPWDYIIRMEYKPTAFFIDLQYKVGVSEKDKQTTIDKLRDHARSVYDAASKAYPGKKIRGEYYHGWYEYPTIQVGYKATSYLVWQNYEDNLLGPEDTYSNSELSSFHFEPRWDSSSLD